MLRRPVPLELIDEAEEAFSGARWEGRDGAALGWKVWEDEGKGLGDEEVEERERERERETVMRLGSFGGCGGIS